MALRELALRLTADEVDEQPHKIVETQLKYVHDRAVVCITPRPRSERLIRRGFQIAKRMKGSFTCIYLKSPGVMLKKDEEANLVALKRLASNMGGELVELVGDSPAREIINFVNSHNTTIVVIGRPAKSPIKDLFNRSIVDKIVKEINNVDVVIVA